ncbi:MAG: class I SAM-dependent methyltransferase [Bacteroidetes bacterium]|nr:class I SAM-dependent methyltransferase [Bacteroidota bacterium]
MIKDPEEIAAQLRLPHGERAKEITDFMEKANGPMYDLALSPMTFAPGDSVLEIGPANGAFLNRIFEKENSIVYSGIDLSKDMVDEANNTHKALVASKAASFVHGSVEEMPFESNSFNHIFTVNTLYFWPDVMKGFDEILRVLKPGGDFSIAIRSADTMKVLPFAAFGFRLYSEDELRSIMEKLPLSHFRIDSRNEKIKLPDGNPAELTNHCAFGVKA